MQRMYDEVAASGPGSPGYHDPAFLRQLLGELEQTHRTPPPAVTHRHHRPPTVPLESIPGLAQVVEICDHLDNVQAWLSAASSVALAAANDPDALFDTTELRNSIVNLFDHAGLLSEMLMAATGVVVRDEPLATTRRSGSRWGGKLTPTDVTRLAEDAATAAETVSYLAGRANQAVAEATSLACDGGALKKECGGTRVRLADGTRAASCWPHLSAEEKAAIRAEREAALTRPCPMCHAPATKPCLDGNGKPTIHNYRLRPETARPTR